MNRPGRSPGPCWIGWLPLLLLGVAPWAIYFGYGINLVYQFFVHTETIGKLPPVRKSPE